MPSHLIAIFSLTTITPSCSPQLVADDFSSFTGRACFREVSAAATAGTILFRPLGRFFPLYYLPAPSSSSKS